MPNPINLPMWRELQVFNSVTGQLCVKADRSSLRDAAMKLATLLAGAWPGCLASAKWHGVLNMAIITPETPMATRVGKAKIKTDPAGKVKIERVHSYDASKKRRIAKSKKVRVKRG